MELFKVEDLTFTYPDQENNALENIHLSVKQGEFIVIFGQSGSGKSTLLRLLKKEIAPSGNFEGEIFFKGEKLDEMDEKNRASKIGFVFQDPESQIVTDKVWHELAFGLENLGVKRDIIRRRVGEMANFFGIHHWFHRKTSSLSGGQKQLLNLASIILMQPEVLLLDEPTAQLDPIAREEFLYMLYKLNRQLGITVILVEHILEGVLPYADRVIFLEEGSVRAEASPREIGRKMEDSPMFQALPTVLKVHEMFDEKGVSPLTVREGKQFIDHKFPQNLTIKKPERKITKDRKILCHLKNLWFRYEKNSSDVVKGVNLSIYENEIFTILGGNGSGKSTLLHLFSGQYKPYKGTVKIDNKKLKKYKNSVLYRDILAYLPQEVNSLFLKSTVKEEFDEMKKIVSYPKEDFQNYLDYFVERLSLKALLERHPFDLSGGEKQKVALTKVLLRKPKILLLDEPTKGMDLLLRRELEDLLIALKSEGMTIVIVTHDVEFASRVADRCGLFFDGQIITIDEPKYFFSKNTFYTTVANQIVRHIDPYALSIEDIAQLARRNDVI